MNARFFAEPADFRQWLSENHDTHAELIVGYWKKATGRPSVTWEETVDEALCYGWIDGIRRRLDDESYCIRFTPRRRDSIWSQRNLDRVAALRADGRMEAPGLAAWQARSAERGYTFEKAVGALTEDEAAAFGPALEHFMQQPPGYRRQMAAWVHSAKRPETRARRLQAVVAASAAGLRVEPGRPYSHLD